jgi:hypothetical protein
MFAIMDATDRVGGWQWVLSTRTAGMAQMHEPGHGLGVLPRVPWYGHLRCVMLSLAAGKAGAPK